MSKYFSKAVDKFGNCLYSKEENKVWEILINRQIPLVNKFACQEYIDGLKLLNFSRKKVPLTTEINEILKNLTGWKVEPVPAIIGPTEFYTLLANKKFPMATFIRRIEDLDYLQEPDVFHELFGHVPLLTNQAYANFLEAYAKAALMMTEKERIRLFRLFWFTVEFGLLINGKIYGAGILSSYKETLYAVGDEATKKSFKISDALLTPFRIDIVQPLYYELSNLSELYKVADQNLIKEVKRSLSKKSYKKLFEKKDDSLMFNKDSC